MPGKPAVTPRQEAMLLVIFWIEVGRVAAQIIAHLIG
jgi:hypothetical protein